MRRREFIGLVGAAVALPLATRAQQPKKVPRIGVLYQGKNAETQPDYTWLRDGFKAVGYADGSLDLEERYYNYNSEKADLLAKELVDLKCDVLIGITAPAAFALRRATSTIPIVFAFIVDPVGSGLVSSLNHPGGNVTGIMHVASELASKRVELLTQAIPGLSSVALIFDPFPPIQAFNRAELEDARVAADRLGLSFESFDCSSIEVLDQAFSKSSRFGATILGNSVWNGPERKRVAELALAAKLAVIGPAEIFTEAGLLMSYGTNWPAVTRAAAPLVKKILEGEKPENIPVQRPTTFDLVFNLKTAHAIGLQIPPMMLALATRVID
jgi:putative tryptophan/tyrosine transport system substrate-binding protein